VGGLRVRGPCCEMGDERKMAMRLFVQWEMGLGERMGEGLICVCV
jgi:hypothetical protein